jgi:hypothetical protein
VLGHEPNRRFDVPLGCIELHLGQIQERQAVPGASALRMGLQQYLEAMSGCGVVLRIQLHQLQCEQRLELLRVSLQRCLDVLFCRRGLLVLI